MKCSDIGEFGLIQRFAPRFSLPADDVRCGIGDDCAVLPLPDKRVQLITTDLLLEDRHFVRRWIAPHELGHKALAVNLSDIAAMGGTPTAAFCSLGLPSDIEVAWIDAFFDGVHALAQATDCPLLGGDTTRSQDRLVINFTVMGETTVDRVKYRSGAQVGDILAVTGPLGDSAGGLRLLQNNHPVSGPAEKQLITAHHAPHPHLEAGRCLAALPAVHARLDVSDGVESDVRHLMERSGVGARIDLGQIPCSPALQAVGHTYKWSLDELALTGGEDYVLLCSIQPGAFDEVSCTLAKETENALHAIGTVTSSGTLTYTRNGHSVKLPGHGFDHFR